MARRRERRCNEAGQKKKGRARKRQRPKSREETPKEGCKTTRSHFASAKL